MANSKNETSNNKDGLALIVGGLFVLALVFATYNYFNTKPSEEDTSDGKTESVEENEKLGDKIKGLFKEDEEGQPDLNGNGATVEKKEAVEENVNTIWIAKDYKQGDISGDTYVVGQGDTLWEISEARYGNGFDWIKILETNAENIGYLANGEQSLILVNQTLVLP